MNYITATIVIISALIHISNACSCIPSHPQTNFCTSDFVILATVKRELVQNEHILYKVKIRKEFKMSEKSKIALKSGWILTPPHASMCGIRLDLNKTYVLSGRIYEMDGYVTWKPFINLCGINRPWSEVNYTQRKGYKLLYSRGCECKLQTYICFSSSCKKRFEGCSWKMNSHCQNEYGICMKNHNGKCKWTKNKGMKKCLKHKKLPIDTTNTTTTSSPNEAVVNYLTNQV